MKGLIFTALFLLLTGCGLDFSSQTEKASDADLKGTETKAVTTTGMINTLISDIPEASFFSIGEGNSRYTGYFTSRGQIEEFDHSNLRCDYTLVETDLIDPHIDQPFYQIRSAENCVFVH